MSWPTMQSPACQPQDMQLSNVLRLFLIFSILLLVFDSIYKRAVPFCVERAIISLSSFPSMTLALILSNTKCNSDKVRLFWYNFVGILAYLNSIEIVNGPELILCFIKYLLCTRLINLMRKITTITFNYEISKTQITMLKLYIQKFIELHDKYYSDSYPKLHYLLHIPSDIEK